MHALAATLLLSLPLAALAGAHHQVPHRRRSALWEETTAKIARRDLKYTLQHDYSGENFFEGFSHFTAADPTNGLVQYVNATIARDEQLAYVTDDGYVKLAVDSTSWLAPGQKRKSVRLQSKDTFNSGLFIADFWNVASGCSTWFAYWTLGTSAPWPNAGEFDIVEGVNLQAENQVTAHTGGPCTLSNTDAATGHLINPVCASSAGNNAGCAWEATGSLNGTFGHEFNMRSGGVWAHQWTDDGFAVWFFARDQIPADVEAGNPDPSTWGPALALFPNNDSCNTKQEFRDHAIIFNIAVCGDWAGSAYPSECPGTCASYVQDPSHFKYARTTIRSLKVYQTQN